MSRSSRRRFPRRHLAVTVAAVLAAAGLSACAGSGSGSEEGTIVFQPATESLAVITQLGAFSEDAFAEADLKIEYNPPIPNAAQAAQSVTGDADIAIVGSSGVLPGVEAGRDMVSVATITKGPTTQITLRNDVIAKLGLDQDAPIAEKMEALKGLSLALTQPGSSTDLAVRESLRVYGMDADEDLTIRPITDPAALVTAMREEQVDGFAFSAPTSVQPVAEGYASVWISLSEVPELEQLPWIDVVTSKRFLEERRDDVVAFVKVLSDMAERLETDTEAVKVDVQEKYFADLDVQTYDLAWDFSLPTALRGIEPSEEGFDVLVQATEDQTGESLDVEFDDVYDLSVLEDART